VAYVVIQQHKFGRMYLCGWSKRWGATVCANRFVAIKYPTEDDAKLARDHAATRCPNFTDGRPIDWQVLEVPPTLDSLPRDEECWVRAAAAPRQFAPQLRLGDQ
jgi:hypothetical protein